jgi:hypothetical protein
MANRDLKNSFFNCPDGIINKLKMVTSKYDGSDNHPNGYSRAKNIINDNKISYQQIKGIKNYFDNYNGDGLDDEYKLNGGDDMKKWVNTTLGNARNTIHDVKKTEMEGGKKNAFLAHHEKDTKNTDPTKKGLGVVRLDKGNTSDSVYKQSPRYESLEIEIDKAKYLMEYMNNNKKII